MVSLMENETLTRLQQNIRSLDVGDRLIDGRIQLFALQRPTEISKNLNQILQTQTQNQSMLNSSNSSEDGAGGVGGTGGVASGVSNIPSIPSISKTLAENLQKQNHSENVKKSPNWQRSSSLGPLSTVQGRSLLVYLIEVEFWNFFWKN